MRTEKDIFKAALALPYDDRVDVLCALLEDIRKEKLAEENRKKRGALRVKPKRNGGRR